MKYFIAISLFFLSHNVLIAQGGKKSVPLVDLAKYASMEDEQAAIKMLDAEYPNTTFGKVDGIYSLFHNRRFDFIRHLLTQFEVPPTQDYLDNLNTFNFVCGVGLKRTKTYSPACPVSKAYEDNAMSNKKIEVAKLVVQKGIKPSIMNFKNCVSKNELALFKYLVTANNNQLPGEISEMIVDASDYGHIDFVKYFLDNNVSPNSYNNPDSRFYAIYRAVKYPEIFFLLVEKGADYKVEGYAGTTPIIHAAREGCLEVLEFLLEKKVDPYEKHGTWTAYDMAKEHNKINRKETMALIKKYK